MLNIYYQDREVFEVLDYSVLTQVLQVMPILFQSMIYIHHVCHWKMSKLDVLFYYYFYAIGLDNL